jgi:hypothetical protein
VVDGVDLVGIEAVEALFRDTNSDRHITGSPNEMPPEGPFGEEPVFHGPTDVYANRLHLRTVDSLDDCLKRGTSLEAGVRPKDPCLTWKLKSLNEFRG